MALIRPFAAILSAICAGLVVAATDRDGQKIAAEINDKSQACSASGCCSTSKDSVKMDHKAGSWRRTFEGLRYAFTDLLDDLALMLLMGIVAAGCVVTVAPPHMLLEWSSGLGAMLLILVISIPMYVCATASTPLAYAMLFAGVSPGTVLVFLLAGPASNIASLTLVRRELGNRTLVAYLSGICGVAILLGLALDWVVAAYGVDILAGSSQVDHVPNESSVVFASLCLLLLLLCGIRPLRNYIMGGKGRDGGSCCG
jgi:uncharacterized protein